MKMLPIRWMLALLAVAPLHGEVVISEIMYHPASEKVSEEFIELHNTGATTADVTGWAFTKGVSFVFPAGSIPADGRLVVAADATAFTVKYPAVSSFVAGWTGRLSNSSDNLRLEDAAGVKVDEVAYSDDGDWAVRAKDTVADYGHYGWGWDTAADGGGSSLELIQEGFKNSTGQNWKASTTAEGTPGVVNSVASADIAPVIQDVSHFPLVPGSSDPVFVTARISDDGGTVSTASVYWRLDGAGSFSAAVMADDGLHGDTLPGDGIFGASLPVQATGTVIEFYVSAEDPGAKTRTWPAPSLDSAGAPGQEANCLYMVDDTPYSAAMPLYQMVMRAADRAELTQINTSSPSIPGVSQNKSHAQMNTSFVSRDGTGSKLRYRCGVRNRGNGSRSAQPQSLRINFPDEDPWDDVTALNLNTQNTHTQLLGSVVYRRAGVTIAKSRAVQLRVNTTNPTSSTGSPAYGFYVANEVINSDFADAHYPDDSSGNIYRGLHLDDAVSADLSDISDNPDPTLADPAPYREHYFKRTNSSEDDWSDLIGLTQVLAKGQSPTLNAPTWDADYADAVRAVADVTQWMRFFAVNTVSDNTETNLANGHGDDYFMSFGVNDPRSELICYDLDSILGRSSGSAIDHSLWQMCTNERLSGDPPATLNPFMKHPDFAPIYYQELKRMIDGAFSPAEFDPVADVVLGGLVSNSVITNLKDFNASRTAWIATQIPLEISVTTAPGSVNGYPQVTSSTVALGGAANAITTRSIKVNGVPADWTAWTASWNAPSVPLQPGINQVIIQAFDENSLETERKVFDVWYDDGSVQTVSSDITADTIWTAAGGPWQIASSISVSSGITLTIDPGASVYLAGGVSFTVASGGKILAEGTETNRLFFGSAPGGSSWGGLVINGGIGSPETRISYAFFDGNSTKAIDVNGADVAFDHLDFGNTNQQYLSLDGASFVVSHCHFPSATAELELLHGTGGVKAGGRGIIRQCWFGKVQGYNDSFDFSGGKRPSPILQIYDCVFADTGDDQLDIDGTDAWIEGNIFLHCHQNGSPDSAASVSGGDGGGFSGDITIIGNLFYDVDSAVTAKQGNYYTFINNTVVRQTIEGGTDTEGGVLNLSDEGTDPGAGLYSEANILSDCEQLTRFYNAVDSVVTFNNNLMNFNWTGPGAGNTSGESLFQHVPTMDETQFENWSEAQIMKQWLSLKDGSPARNTGPNGRDKGGVVPVGICVSANVPELTNLNSAIISVGPVPSAVPTWSSGYTYYRWRLDGGPWSAEFPTATPVSLSGLSAAEHTLEVVGKNDALTWQDDPDLGETSVPASFVWTVDPGYIPPAAAPWVRISEVLAKNTETLEYSGVFPDIIELHNAGNATAILDGWGLTDKSSVPYKYTFPVGTNLAPGAYLVIHASSDLLVPEPKTGFGLNDGGETLTLRKSAPEGSGIVDSVPFGNQLPDYSIGRRASDGEWDLCRPTFGGSNIVATQSNPYSLRINEWLASAGALSPTDFIELYNPDTLPVNIGNGYLTNNPVEWPDQHLIRQLTFVGAGGYAYFKADDDINQGPDHLAFKLSATQGEIGLFDSGLALIDSIIYGPQSTDVSQGRSPNGESMITFFSQPTPGSPNPGTIGGGGTESITLLSNDADWRYDQTGTDLSGVFQSPAYDDDGWSGPSPGLLYVEGSGVPWTKNTSLTLGRNTYYFRTSFDAANIPAGATDQNLQFTVCVDDGFIAYLNGTEILRVGVDSGSVDYTTFANRSVGNAVLETFDLSPAAHALLQPTGNVLAVEVHQTSTDSSDIVWGAELLLQYTPLIAGTSNLVLNEIITTPDIGAGWLEIINTAATGVVLTDASLTNNVSDPRKYVFPAGLSIPANDRIVISCDSVFPASASNTGFALNGIGGSVHMFGRLSEGGGLVDGVTYGNQLAGYSIARIPDTTGQWVLSLPTSGVSNVASATGSLSSVKVNEWLAKAAVGPDWLELFNTSASPVPLGGNYLTDNLSSPDKHLITPLTFIGGSGSNPWLQFIADGNASQPGHVGFSLKASGEELGLYTASGVAIDAVAFGAQTSDVSMGRFPDGSATVLTMLPTPAAANAVAEPDTDGDGMPDAWEGANGLNYNWSGDAVLDSDHDGLSNLHEYLAGTDPQDASSRFTNSVTIDGGMPTIRFIARAGLSYTVQYSGELSGVWAKLTDVVPQPVTVEVSVSDPGATGQLSRFYRVITPVQP